MENQILQDLFYGNILPNEMAFRKDSGYAKALADAVSLSDQIRDLLPEGQQALVEKLATAQSQYSSKAEEEQFILGFRLGAKIMLAVLTGESDTFTEI